MKILHTEASLGWGGQEIRTYKESLALRERGHEVLFIIQKGAKLAEALKREKFHVLEIQFFKKYWFLEIPKILRFLQKNKINLVVTHSSLDAWLGGICAKLLKLPVVRVRHVTTPTKKGLNAKLLFHRLCDFIITTSSEIIQPLAVASGKDMNLIKCIPTGVDPNSLQVSPEEIKKFKSNWGIREDELLLGTVCVVRSWKGINTLIDAAYLLKDDPKLKWLIVGGGYLDAPKQKVRDLGLESKVIFTGHIDNPKIAIASLDIFLLLSTANEGISQATLQASYLQKPMITTPTGGLKEVCINEQTGFVVPLHSPDKVIEAIARLQDPALRQSFGKNACENVNQSFLLEKTLQEVEKVYLRFVC